MVYTMISSREENDWQGKELVLDVLFGTDITGGGGCCGNGVGLRGRSDVRGRSGDGGQHIFPAEGGVIRR